ncbi:hypothetical protein FACS1894190_17640 [Spirochaetia bacterium]|nr:hypothetical protein FACS1894190_17640 [Spirochaetia bacterium]
MAEMENKNIEATGVGMAISDIKTKSTDLLAIKLSRFLDRKTGPTMERTIAREGINNNFRFATVAAPSPRTTGRKRPICGEYGHRY